MVKGSETIKLLVPVIHAGETITQLEMRRPTFLDTRTNQQVRGSDIEREATMFSNLCEVAPDVINALDMADYLDLQDTYSGFLSSKRNPPASSSDSSPSTQDGHEPNSQA
ncbi:Uncharacterised protein [BD1-7 clade bacterium]|uniref:Phage tail assembly protein n=1 Tax=BD1-7 clade bacterium TaxID=2029982 RepID=A0A5S9Q2R5_9GAMM|nr:Uncharacterised protein [BD1-7 clade bacterium]CAA0111843.1 Uncharacterised protein [BD1-7 clade bacterium]